MDTLLQDARYALRSLSRTRGLAATAVATLAVGIAATTTMFGVVDATLWRPLPLERADRLAILYQSRTTGRDGLTRLRWSVAGTLAVERAATSFESMASFSPSSISIVAGSVDPASGATSTAPRFPEQVDAEIVAPAYFRTLRIAPASGRVFTGAEDTTPAAHPVAIISESLARRYHPESSPLGASLRVNDVALTVIGVMPAGFRGLSGKAEIWLPRMMAPLLTYSEYLTTPQHFIMLIARLNDGVTIDAANAELATIGERIGDPSSGEPARWSALARPLGEARIDIVARRSAFALLGAAACVLLIACVNVASLLLARARTRQREIAVRLALGASRWWIVRQLLTEGVLIALAAGVAGVVLATWGIALFARSSPAVIATGRNDYAALAAFAAPTLDARVLAFALTIALGTTVIFALAPAWATARPDLVPALKDDDRAGSRRAFGGLVVAEVALAMLLLISAGVLIDSFVQMQRQRAGFDTDGVLTFWVRPSNARYQPADGPAIVERLLTRVESTPGVVAAAVNRAAPFSSGSRSMAFFPDRPADRANAPAVGRHYISTDYFRALGIPLLAGRALTPADRPGAPAVTVINETAARRFWPGDNAIGKRVWFGTTTGPFADREHAAEVVGIVGDVKYDGPDQPVNADFYTSYLQFSFPDTMLIVKTRGAPNAIVPAMRAAVASVDASLPIYDVLALDARIDGVLARPRFNAGVAGAFAAIALALAAFGIYGVLSYSVSSRRREIGVRLAIGADARRIVTLVVREGLTLAVVGVIVGLAGAAAAGVVLRRLLVGAQPADARLLVAGSLLMLGVAALAALVPARRAAGVDPLIVLRD